jgi:hypothetical protein
MAYGRLISSNRLLSLASKSFELTLNADSLNDDYKLMANDVSKKLLAREGTTIRCLHFHLHTHFLKLYESYDMI